MSSHIPTMPTAQGAMPIHVSLTMVQSTFVSVPWYVSCVCKPKIMQKTHSMQSMMQGSIRIRKMLFLLFLFICVWIPTYCIFV